MLDYEKIGQQIALLRKEKGLTGERLAEALDVSPQAVSKWENGKCLPETALLPRLAKLLDCSIDTLLMPKELVVLEAVYTDGVTTINVTQTVNYYIKDNKLTICVSGQLVGAVIDSSRAKLLTVKYQTPGGTYFTFGMQNEILNIDTSEGQTNDKAYLLLGAYYGNANGYVSAMQKMEHYEYFKWDKIHVNHETFPSNTATDDTEYLTLVYLNKSGVHAISCAENDTIYYSENRTFLYLKDHSKCILPGIERLEWTKGKECPWAGALYAALKYMGEDYTYEQIMGMSGACYRVCFVDVWDWSCTDALVSFDYGTPLYNAIGYNPIWANRLEKSDRKAERLAIMRDLQNDKPVLAINLRVAPEWGVITGYLDNGNSFLCRTYFDQEVFEGWENGDNQNSEDRIVTFEERGGYLVNDFWPFLITHFGERKSKPSDVEILMTSLKTLVEAFNAERCGGYYQGRQGYEAWIKGLLEDKAFDIVNDKDNAFRRLGVNESMLFHLMDARRCAGIYLRGCADLLDDDKRIKLNCMADHYETIYKNVSAFRDKVKFCYDTQSAQNANNITGVITKELRNEQIELLKNVLRLEEEIATLASEVND